MRRRRSTRTARRFAAACCQVTEVGPCALFGWSTRDFRGAIVWVEKPIDKPLASERLCPGGVSRPCALRLLDRLLLETCVPNKFQSTRTVVSTCFSRQEDSNGCTNGDFSSFPR